MELRTFVDELIDLNIRIQEEEGQIKLIGSKENITPEIISRIRTHKDSLLRYLQSAKTGDHAGIPVAEMADDYPMSSSQRHMWILSQFEEGSAYHVPSAYLFEGMLNRHALENAFTALVERHEILRTVFRENEQGEVRQFVFPLQEFDFRFVNVDLRKEQQDLLDKLLNEQAEKPFDLAKGPLLRAVLYQLADEKYVFSYVLHHIISDAWSTSILIKEVMQLYNAFSSGMASPLRPLKIQYKDYAAWQQQQLSGKLLEEHRAYWLQQFEGEIPVLELNGDKTRPAVKTYNGAVVEKSISKEIAGILQELCNKQGSTLFMGLLAAVNTLLYRYTGQQDIVIGTPIAGREHADLEDQIGFYVNTLALRTRFNAAEGFLSLLEHVKQTTLGAYRHQAYPFDELVEALQPERDLSRNALFDVMLSLNKTVTGARKDEQLGSLHVSAYGGSETVQTKFDLVFNFAEAGEELLLTLEYNTDIYNASTAGQLAEHLVQLLEVAVKSPAEPIELIDYLSEEEKRRLLVTFNETEVAYPKDKTILDLFHSQVNANPCAIALVYENITVSYKELDERSNTLAAYLRHKYDIKPGDLAGILLERSEWMIIAILAVLKSGAAYVPIDTEYPQERIDYMIADSNCKVLIDHNEISTFRKQQHLYLNENVESINKPSDLAYVIYTSGSTGRPKGVMIEHGSIHARIQYFIRSYDLNESDRSLFYRSYSFDGSIEEYLLPILSGACMVIAPSGFRNDVLNNIIDYTERFGITKINMPPVVLGELVQQADEIVLKKLSSLKHVVSGGDKLTVKIVNDYLEKFTASLYNTYGPTENTIDSTSWKASKISVAQVPIGKPVENSQGYILDHKLQPVPTGVSGELYVSGAGLARGYLNNESLTKEKFVAHPFRQGERMYRTGDRGRWLEDGNIEFLGRIDEQVKIRGFRIEPGEIENAIASFENMEACVVVAKAVHQSEKELVAYVVSKSPLNVSELRSHLAGKLPSFMVPSYFVQLEQLPLTSNGKTDKKKLPDPENIGIENTETYVAPRNNTEEKLAAIWQEVLGKERVSVKDNFFELGGHSLKATRLGSRIHKTFEVKLSLTELFSAAILEDQARLIAAAVKTTFSDISQVPEQSSYSLSSSQRRLWVLSQFEAGNVAYNMPGVYVFEGELDRQALEDAFATLIERHEILRTVFKEDEQGEVKQFILSPAQSSFNIAYHDLRSEQQQEDLLRSLLQHEAMKPFDLTNGPLLSASLYHTADTKYVFSYVMHHIISDGWSMGILLKELVQLYGSYSNDKTSQLAPLRIQYKDYAAWQQQQLTGSILEEHKAYWLKQFEGELPVLELLSDRVRPAIQTFNGGVLNKRLQANLHNGLKKLGHEQGCTLFMGLLATVNTLFHHYTGQQDIIIGTPIAGREHADLEGQIGFYVNTLALRTHLNKENNFKDLLNETKKITLGAYEHQVYPFDELVDALHLPRDVSRNPLFDVMIILQNTENYNLRQLPADKLSVKEYDGITELISKTDLTFSFTESDEDLLVRIEYNSDIFRRDTIERIGNHLEQLLAEIIAHPSTPISHLNYLLAAEKQLLLHNFNDTATTYARNKTIINLFEEQVQNAPGKAAIIFEDKQLSYAAFNEKANRLGNYLRAKYNVQPNDLVALKLNRSEWMLIAIFGVLKSGAAYVPIDPQFPQERIDYMLNDSSSKVLLDEEALAQFVKDETLYDANNPAPVNLPSDLAYVIYTSGSTGNPKGVMIEHRSVVSLVQNFFDRFSFTPGMVFGSPTTYTFDMCITELLGAPAAGLTLFLIAKSDPVSLLNYIDEGKIDILQLTPSRFSQLLDISNEGISILSKLKTLLVGGEGLSQAQFAKLKEISANIVHVYGPTETTVWSTSIQIAKDTALTVGRPLKNETVYILNNELQLCAIGIAGEICIGGEGLARGYLNNVELSAAKFVADPFKPGERIYRTGDLGRWLADGTIEFIGRKDEQVKIRGYRIELGEIESILLRHQHVDAAVATAKTNSNGEKELCVYVVSEQTLNAGDLRTYMAEALPAYMLPTHFIQLEQLPLSNNGKVDRKKLPDPGGLGLSSGKEYIAPRTETEKLLAAIWQEILEKEQLSVNDNFFELGGHSLKATRLISRIHRSFNVKLTLNNLFAVVVLQEQAKLIDAAIKASFTTIPRTKESSSYALSPSQRRLWVVSQLADASVAYNIPGVYVFDGNLNKAALEQALDALVERHESLRTVFREDNGEVKQFILPSPASGFRMSFTDVKNELQKDELVKKLITEERAKPFDLSEGPLLRAELYQLSDSKWIFSYVMHHIISDAWSINVLIRETIQLYNAYAHDLANTLAPLNIQYKDYAAWLQEQLSGESLIRHREYWLNQFEGELPVLQMPADKKRPAVKTYNGGVVSRRMNAQLHKSITGISQQQGGTLFMGLMASVNALLYRYTGQEDIIIGTPAAGRDHADLENQIGFYVNTLVLRTRFNGKDSFKELLGRTKQLTLDAYKHQAYPLNELVEELDIRRDVSRNPLFDVWVVVHNNQNNKPVEPAGLSISNYEGIEGRVSRFDLLFNFIETAEGILVSIQYNSDIFNSDTINRLCDHLVQLTEAVVAQPDTSLDQLEFLNKEELKELVLENAVDYPSDKTIVQLFEDQVRYTPENIALAGDERAFTYKQLNEIANQLGNYLHNQYDIQPGDIIGLQLERNELLIVAILGILKTGAAYLPIDIDYPAERVNYMLDDSNCKAVIDTSEWKKFIASQNEFAGDDPVSKARPGNLAYVIYTSGSTGQPKGVMISNRAVVDYTYGILNRTNIKECKSFGLVSTVSADLGNTVIYPSLLTGGTLHVFSSSDVMNPEKMLGRKLDCIKIVPSHWKALQAGKLFAPEKCLVFGGEALTPDIIDTIRTKNGKCKVYNHYGPSETTIGKLAKHIDINAPGEISLGTPIGNTRVYILDEYHKLVPKGVIGEICIAGHGVAKGYLNKPELTAQKFVGDPFAEGEVMYKTGDRGRILHDNTIAFYGRKDDQVKIRGFRIEPGEIERVLLSADHVESAVVVVRENGADEKMLVAYVVVEKQFNMQDARAYLAAKLPAYMVPSHIIQLAQLPLTANGKIDKRSLPVPEEWSVNAEAEYIAPRNETEEKLEAIWSEVLDKEKISVRDNFFELGGHSLNAIRIVVRVHEHFGVEMDLTSFFGEPTIESLATEINNILWLRSSGETEIVMDGTII